MNFTDVIKGRRSVRKFLDKTLGEGQIEKLLEATSFAPSAGNIQSFEIVLVKDRDKRKELAVAAFSQNFVSEVPVIFVFCANQKKIKTFYGDRGVNLFSLMDAAAAVENLLLTAEDLGLGACWIGAFDEKKVKTLLNLPEGIRPVALVPVGYPDESPEYPKPDSSRRGMVVLIMGQDRFLSLPI